jgi:hypothetical protein
MARMMGLRPFEGTDLTSFGCCGGRAATGEVAVAYRLMNPRMRRIECATS